MRREPTTSPAVADAVDPSAGTGERILAAARELMVEQGHERLSLERVAERAQVARATIYNRFGSKSGLMEGLLEAIERDARVHETRQQDRTFGDVLRRVTGIWETEGDVLRSLMAMSVVDPQVRRVLHRHQRGRRQRLVELVEQLDDAGQLRADPEDAIDLLWLLTSFQVYDFLRQRTARDPDGVRALLSTLTTNLLATGGAHA